jgi:hypothetical protein
MPQVNLKTRRRLRLNNIVALLSWCLNLALLFTGAPLWSVLLIGVFGSYFALRDWRVLRSLARESILPSHPDQDVQALIEGSIDISEYRRRKE